MTSIFLGVALAATPALAQHADKNHTAAGEPLHKQAATDFEGPADTAALYRAVWTADLAGTRAAVAKNPAVLHSDHDSAMTLAAQGDSLAVLRFLHRRGGNLAAEDNAPLTTAVTNGNVQMFNYIARNLPATPQAERDQLMVVAAYGDSLDMIKSIHRWHAKTTGRLAGDWPVSAASKHGTPEILPYLVDKLHADIHAGNEDALRQAVSHNRADSVRFLLKRGANPHALNDEALRFAVDGGMFDHQDGRIGYPDIVAALLEYGANPFAISPEKLAQTEKKYPAVAALLKTAMARHPVRPALSAPQM